MNIKMSRSKDISSSTWQCLILKPIHPLNLPPRAAPVLGEDSASDPQARACVLSAKPTAKFSQTMTMQNYSESEAKALQTIFRYYATNDTQGKGSHIRNAAEAYKFIYLAQLYLIVSELGQNDQEISQMKNAISRQSKNNDTLPLGCISLQDFLHVLDQGREKSTQDDNFHFIRAIAEYERRSETSGQYLLAKEFLDHRKSLQKEEENRQLAIIKQKHIENKRKIVIAHDQQMVVYNQRWDDFLKEFEQKSQTYLEELHHTHETQIASLHKEVVEQVKSKPQRWSKELVDWRKREAIMADQQKYKEAQKIKTVSDALEAKERSEKNSSLENSLKLKEGNLAKQQAAEKAALLQRIETKRQEFRTQQKADYARMLQRNKNIIAMLDSKHVSSYCIS